MLFQGFGAFERSILTQVDHILMDKERLLRRTQTKRSAYRVLGKTPPAAEVLPETELAETVRSDTDWTKQREQFDPLIWRTLILGEEKPIATNLATAVLVPVMSRITCSCVAKRTGQLLNDATSTNGRFFVIV